ncbi:TPA: hypothetical protein DCZ36_03275 [Candidatus Gracilibacteria bacterium]|nr:hypothetical protein [Candidatus Gracilibacteria bacterium]
MAQDFCRRKNRNCSDTDDPAGVRIGGKANGLAFRHKAGPKGRFPLRAQKKTPTTFVIEGIFMCERNHMRCFHKFLPQDM